MSFLIYGGKMRKKKEPFWKKIKNFEFQKWHIAVVVIIALLIRFWGEDTITMLQKKVPVVTDTEFSSTELNNYITTKQQYIADRIAIDPVLSESSYLEEKLDRNIHEWFLVRQWRPKRFFYVEKRIKFILTCLHHQQQNLNEADRLEMLANALLKKSFGENVLENKSQEAADLNKKANDLRFYLEKEIREAGISTNEEQAVRDYQDTLEALIER